MNEPALRAELDACLLPLPSDGPVVTADWLRLPDPFPEWRKDAA